MDTAKVCVQQNIQKANFHGCVTKLRKNQITSKDFIKTFPTYFPEIFFQHFSNTPYSNVNIILAYFCIIKTI